MKNWEITLNLGEKIPGKELLALLLKINETGSLVRAAAEAGLSYRYGWGLLRRAEEVAGKTLVLRQSGGLAGGGSRLTEEGRKLLGYMQSLQREVQWQLSFLLEAERMEGEKQVLLASTLEPIVTGLLDVLEQAYLQKAGVAVRHIAAGSSQALEIAKAGRVDLVLTHAPALEAAFISAGWGTRRQPVMSSDFLLVGPPLDPARIAEATCVVEAFRRIAREEVPFVSRGDRSGTHLAEKILWQQAGILPEGCYWYHQRRNMLGNYGILRSAAELNGYALLDRASYVTGSAGTELKILFSGDPGLNNVFSAISVSNKKAAVNQEEADSFVQWLVSPVAGKLIAGFGRQQYGSALFVPLES